MISFFGEDLDSFIDAGSFSTIFYYYQMGHNAVD